MLIESVSKNELFCKDIEVKDLFKDAVEKNMKMKLLKIKRPPFSS